MFDFRPTAVTIRRSQNLWAKLRLVI